MPVMRKEERGYMGMFEYQSGEETIIIRRIIYELKLKVVVTLVLGLPAFILFMCTRVSKVTTKGALVANQRHQRLAQGHQKVLRRPGYARHLSQQHPASAAHREAVQRRQGLPD